MERRRAVTWAGVVTVAGSAGGLALFALFGGLGPDDGPSRQAQAPPSPPAAVDTRDGEGRTIDMTVPDRRVPDPPTTSHGAQAQILSRAMTTRPTPTPRPSAPQTAGPSGRRDGVNTTRSREYGAATGGTRPDEEAEPNSHTAAAEHHRPGAGRAAAAESDTTESGPTATKTVEEDPEEEPATDSGHGRIPDGSEDSEDSADSPTDAEHHHRDG